MRRYWIFMTGMSGRRLLMAGMIWGGYAPAIAAQSQPARHDFPYPSRFVEVAGARMHYVEAGSGDPIVFVHGQPTWGYIWRDILPHLEASGRVIALDLIGFGKSDRPPIAYRLEDHVAYFEGFIDALGLRNVTFVAQDWGSFLAFQYASRFPDNVRALVFMEAILPPDFFRPSPDAPHYERALAFFEAARIVSSDTALGHVMIEERNAWIEEVLPANVLRELTPDELDAYREPFRDPTDRLPMLQFPRSLRSTFGFREIGRYSEWLAATDLPKLVFTVEPGVTAPVGQVDWIRANLSNVTIVPLGEGLHYLQEDYPDAIGRGVADWLRANQ